MAAASYASFDGWLRAQMGNSDIGLTQLAAKAGISSGYVSLLSRGHRKPSFRVIVAIAEALDVNVEEALKAAGINAQRIERADEPHGDEGRALAFDIASLSPRPAKDALCAILDRLARSITFDYGNISSVENKELHIMSHKVGTGAALLGKPSFVPQPWPAHTGLTGAAASTGTSIRVSDVRSDPRYLRHLDRTRSELAVPLILEGTVIGVINLESDYADAFTRADERRLESVSTSVASAVVRAKAQNELDELRMQVLGLRQLYQINLEKRDEPSLLQEFASGIVGVFSGFDLCVIRIYDDEKGRLLLRAVAHRHMSRIRFEEVGLRLGIDDSISGLAVRTHRALSRRDVMNDPDFKRKELANRLELRGMVAAPIPSVVKQEPPIGSVSVYATSMEYRFQGAHERLLEDIGQYISVALTNLRNSLRYETVVETGQLCRKRPRSRTNLDQLCGVICRKIGSKGASIFLADEKRETLSLAGTTGLIGIKDYAQAEIRLGEGKTGWVGKYGKSMRLIRDDSLDELSMYPGAEESFKYVEYTPLKNLKQGFLAVPIVAENSVVGVIRAAIGREDNLDFTPFDEAILKQVAHHLGLSLEGERGQTLD